MPGHCSTRHGRLRNDADIRAFQTVPSGLATLTRTGGSKKPKPEPVNGHEQVCRDRAKACSRPFGSAHEARGDQGLRSQAFGRFCRSAANHTRNSTQLAFNGQDVQQALWAWARSVTRSTTADYSTSTRSRNVNTETVSLLPVQPHESLSLFLVKELLRIQHMTMLQQLHLPEHS